MVQWQLLCYICVTTINKKSYTHKKRKKLHLLLFSLEGRGLHAPVSIIIYRPPWRGRQYPGFSSSLPSEVAPVAQGQSSEEPELEEAEHIEPRGCAHTTSKRALKGSGWPPQGLLYPVSGHLHLLVSKLHIFSIIGHLTTLLYQSVRVQVENQTPCQEVRQREFNGREVVTKLWNALKEH